MWIDVALLVLLHAMWWSWPCRHYLKYYDDLCSLFMLSMIISIYMWSNVKLCILILMLFRWSCRLWLCSSMSSLRVYAWLYLLDYMSLWWLYWWCYSSVCIGWLKDHNDYSYVLLGYYNIRDNVKSLVCLVL